MSCKPNPLVSQDHGDFNDDMKKKRINKMSKNRLSKFYHRNFMALEQRQSVQRLFPVEQELVKNEKTNISSKC